MAPADLTCCIRVEKTEGNDCDNGQPQEVVTLPLRDCPDIGIEIRTRWATEVMKHFKQIRKPRTCIRPWDFVERLAQRLDGLPLALATAGTYLNQSADSFDEYFELYDHRLYSTWNLSFKQVQDQDPAAAELLKLMAYLDNQDL